MIAAPPPSRVLARRSGLPTSREQFLSANPHEPGHGIAARQLRDFARKQGLQAF